MSTTEIILSPTPEEAGVFNPTVTTDPRTGEIVMYYRRAGLGSDYPRTRLYYATSRDNTHFERKGPVTITFANEELKRRAGRWLDHSAEDPRFVTDENGVTGVTVVGLEEEPYTHRPGHPQLARTLHAKVSQDFSEIQIDQILTPEEILATFDDRHRIPFNKGWVLSREQVVNSDSGNGYSAPNGAPSTIYIARRENPLERWALLEPREGYHWESAGMGGVGPTPLEIPDGWLVFAIGKGKAPGDRYHTYYLEAVRLDGKKPTKVLNRSEYPLLSPEADHNAKYPLRVGQQPFGAKNVFFSSGVLKTSESVILYSGANDRYITRTVVPLEEIYHSFEKNHSHKTSTKSPVYATENKPLVNPKTCSSE
jgi:predicted GH43/DUF377 family glycosyl hydrolase